MDIQAQYQPGEYVFDLFKDLKKNDLEYIFRGNFTSILVNKILSFADSNLEKAEDTSKVKSRIYFIMGEGLQNITKHQDLPEDNSIENSTFIILKKKDIKYYLTTANLIHSNNIPPLESKLEMVNSLTFDELKDYARFIRKNAEFTEKGGASLGLIEMAKRSNKKLNYKFKKINEEYSYFYLKTEIPFSHYKELKLSYNEIDTEDSLDDIIKFHNFINNENLIFNFKGDFNQENLLSLLAIVEKQMNSSTTSIKVYNVMVELVQNIVKHADNINGQLDWRPGMFYINENNTEFLLTAGNYILNSKVDEFRIKLEYINSVEFNDLQKLYNSILMDFDHQSALKTGLGIIDMRKRSGKTLDFNFAQIDDQISMFIIQVRIEKK